MFIAWLHKECGYTFNGDTTFYGLTVPELRTLSDGFELMHEQHEMQEKGVSPGTQRRFKSFAQKVNSGSYDPEVA